MTSGSAQKVIDLISERLNDNKDKIIAVCNGDMSALWEDDTISDMILALYDKTPFYGFNFDEIVSNLNLSEDCPEEKLKKIIGRLIADKKLEYVD